MATKDIKKEESSINIEKIKEEINEYAKEKIDSETQNFFKRNEKRIIKIKNNSIIKRDIIIILLIGLTLFLCYQLNEYGYFGKFVKNNNINSATNNMHNNINNDNNENENNVIKSELIDEYSYLLEPLKYPAHSFITNNLYNGNLDNDTLMSIALLNVDNKYITNDEEGYYVESDKLLDTCQNIFGEICELKSFKYENIKIRYLKSMNIFMYDEKIDFDESNIIRCIYDIVVEDDVLTIYTFEAEIVNDKIYNYINNTEVKKCTIENMEEYKDKLSKIKYSFLKQGDKYILDKVSGE